MTWTRWTSASILLGLAVVGCQRKAAEPEGPLYPTPAPITAEMRERVRHMASDAVVGQVIAIMPEVRLVAVGDVPVQEFRKGDIFMFLGGDDATVGAGTVVNVLADALHLRYQEPTAGGRPPAVGDLAIHFKK